MSSIKLEKTPLSCIKDMPIQADNDQLKANGYAKALCKFIKNADTPVTIGIQGGWGSGKSSLFTLMQSILSDEKTALFVVLNAWEHSLFAEHGTQSNVVLSVLRGLIESITKEIDNPDTYIDPVPKSILKELGEGLKTTMRTIGNYLPVIAQLAAFGAAGTPMSKGERADYEVPRLAEEIHNLKSDLNKLVAQIKRDKKPLKTVIFIDDLDRVSPPVAVQILDVLKNVFDVNNCIFVLAIDYEVIVKGLESKFGKRSDSNEREFRQYFDKIIQIPFTMPVGAYSQAMDTLLKDSFERLDIYDNMEIDDKIIKNISKIAKLSTGGIPRSIKRILNTLSLLQYIADNTGDNENNAIKLKYLQIRFIIVSLLINFPEICRRLMEKNNFTSWKIEKLNTPWQLEYYEKYEKELNEIAKNKELELYFNDDWEKIIYCICSKSSWLKSKAYNVSKIMNSLKNILNDFNKEDISANSGDERKDDEARPDDLSDSALEALSKILSSINVVSVDFDNSDNGDELYRYDSVSGFMKSIHRELVAGELSKVITPVEDINYAIPSDENDHLRSYRIECKNSNITEILLTFDEDTSWLTISFYAKLHGKNKNSCQKIITKFENEFENSEIMVNTAFPNVNGEILLKTNFIYMLADSNLEKIDMSSISKLVKNFYDKTDNLLANIK